MRTCARPGCEQAVIAENDHCYRCCKILAGLITTTRGESRLDILPVELTAAEREAAAKAHADRFEEMLRRTV